MIETTDHDKSRLNMTRLTTLAALVFVPLVGLFVGYTGNFPGIGAVAGNELMLYLLLAWSALTPLIWPVLARAFVTKYRAGEMSGKTPADLFFQMSLIRLSLVVSIYVFGFGTLLVAGDPVYMLYFYPIGIAWSYVHWPRRERYEQLLKKLEQT